MSVVIQEMEVGTVQRQQAPAPQPPPQPSANSAPPAPAARDIERAVEHRLQRDERIWAH